MSITPVHVSLGVLIAACLLAACFQPLNLGPVLGWVALLPLLWTLRALRPWSAFWFGWLFGLVVNVSLCAALLPIPSMHVYQVLLICAYLACYPALWSALISAWSARSPLFPVFGAALWVALDYVKAHAGFLAFPIGSLAQTQVDNVWLVQCASLFGEAAVTGLVVWGNLVLWRALQGVRGIETGWSLLPIAIALGFGALTTMTAQAVNRPGVQVAVLQTDFTAFGPEHIDTAARMQQTFDFIRASVPREARMIVLPESSFVNLSDDPERLSALQALADGHQATLVAGVAQALKFDRPGRVEAADSRVRAGAWIFEAGRSEPRRYDKVHRLPFAEYLPMPQWVSWPLWLVTPPLEVVESVDANAYQTFSGPIGIMICWDSAFAGHARTLARNGAGILLQLSNEGWFSHTAAGRKHNATVRMRAVETARPTIASSNAGPAIIVDAFGRVIAQASSDAPMSWVTATVWPRSPLSLYARIGDAVVGFCMAVAIAAWMVERRRTRRDSPSHVIESVHGVPAIVVDRRSVI